jgi:high-affinity nickel-transport protein
MATIVSGAPRSPLRTAAPAIGVVLALHVIGVGLFGLSLVPGTEALPVGFAAAAYLLGFKHSYDWDHIAAIDNATRRLVSAGRNPVGVGLAFSLGHSSVVTLAGVLVIAGAGFIQRLVGNDSGPPPVLVVIGSLASGLFLLFMGLANAATVTHTASLRQRVHEGAVLEPKDLEARGVVARLLDRPLSRVRRGRDLYAVGFLFGLGFDTATTVGVLMLAASASLAGVPPLALLSLPILFTAAMALFDTANGMAVSAMYRSAVSDPARKLGFNLAITSVSSGSALFISILILGTLAHDYFGLTDPVTGWLAGIDLGDAGLLLVGGMLVVWAAAAGISLIRRPRH